jgi:hypothetical protein
MKVLTIEEIKQATRQHGISYRAPRDADPMVVRTSMAKPFPIPQQTVFDSFADPVAHVKLFAIIQGSTPAIRRGIEPLLKDNQFMAFEHVQEGKLKPRMMLLKYTLKPPRTILKEGVTDPFIEGDVHIMDKKRAKVRMDFEKLSRRETDIKTTSSFAVSTGAVFSRAFIDSVWLNFFERMMVANGMLDKKEMRTGP